ncbi:TerB family tellurite resistance protein [Leeuwenhoekiella marinoflava]|uniref:DnaJ like chaperone protein n=2 Tax=Leeuwenhoekiella marinoflava TaxID=988 RepID=A0A4Q0P8S7_9FLAO|nr:TerB family tellurite resistance protein [Leeuwenhoekiella marinoflava]RXG23077.1 DnaJ like chaperone protein [Leeuwenhoekiella marinoflava]SHE29678.1 DnaJ like chaperone protein [Leeuwenhoekiella marinoflava DSM 3653]
MVRWIGAIIGLAFRGWMGGIAGYVIGMLIDNLFFNKNTSTSSGRSSAPFGSQEQTVTPGDFELNLLSLCSIVIKADGQVSQREMDYVRQYFVQAYGKERANATFRTFNEVVKKREINAQRICAYLTQRTRREVRLQIVHFLFGIAQADGSVSASEVDQISQIAGYLGLSRGEFESLKAMFFKNADSAYKILEIEKTATDAEVKKAYRAMAKKYHPDKLQHMDEAYRAGAEEKFRNVQDAYDTIQKERGI